MPVVEDKPISEVIINLDEDKTLRNLLDYQDKQEVDSLILYFSDKNPTYRYTAAMAMASIKSPKAIEDLKNLLTDNVSKVRTAAAFALGQIGDDKAEDILVASFDQEDSLAMNYEFNAAVLEAVGKCGNKNNLNAISSVTTYRRSDTLLVKGQALAIYRYALRNIVSDSGTDRMTEILTKNGFPEEVQTVAANYFYRAKKVVLDTTQTRMLGEKFIRLKNPEIKMALAFGLAKTKSNIALDYLISGLRGEPDYRVKSNIIRSLSNFDYVRVKPLMLGMLNDDNKHVSNTAAEYFVKYGVRKDVQLYRKKALEQSHWWPRANMYKAANKYLSPYSVNTRVLINNEIKKRFDDSNNLAEKAVLLKAMAAYPKNLEEIKTRALNSDQPLLRVAGVESLVEIVENENFVNYMRSKTKIARKEIGELFKVIIDNADEGMVAVAAVALRNPANKFFKDQFEEIGWMKEGLKKLKLPRDIEAYNELEKTIAYFKTSEKEGEDNEEKPTPEIKLKKPAYNHPINWRIVKNITDRTRAKIQTNRGVIIFKFLKNEAPASCANFVELAKDGFYDGKSFHRVVSNFVVQGGCPRGDGYGALDYTIRSEISQVSYDDAGYVGMASSGNHTECTQWFITHSPTLHLDGNYTIFAQVDEGMDIVHKIEPGDIIEKILIIN